MIFREERGFLILTTGTIFLTNVRRTPESHFKAYIELGLLKV